MLLVIALLLDNAGGAWAQAYPQRPVRIVTGGVGGGNDFAARLLSPRLTTILGQQIVVDNRASQLIATEIAAKASPDGYILLIAASALWIAPLIEKLSYDPVKDFAPIAVLVSSPQVLVVHPGLGIATVKELIALARSEPGKLNYASGPSGSPNHLAPELFKAMAHVNIVRVPYKGAGPALNDLISGQVQLMFGTAGSVAPHVKSRRLIAVAITSAEPSLLFPGLVTVAASGLPGYESVGLLGLLAPAKTPPPIISRLNSSINQALSEPPIRQRFLDSGVETVGGTSEAFSAAMKSDMARMGKVIRDAGIRPD
jgi:tripartite-type tricarboxylate transporter receptor subunit TctC